MANVSTVTDARGWTWTFTVNDDFAVRVTAQDPEGHAYVDIRGVVQLLEARGMDWQAARDAAGAPGAIVNHLLPKMAGWVCRPLADGAEWEVWRVADVLAWAEPFTSDACLYVEGKK